MTIAVISVYVALLAYVAARARIAHEFVEFSLAKRALPLALIFGSLAATYVGPAFTIGLAGRGFTSGFLFWGIGLAYAVQNILVGFLIAPRLRNMENCHTLGDAIGQKYDLKCQVVAGVISVGLCTGFAAVMAKAGGVVLTNILNLPKWSSVAIAVGVTASYTTFGGLRASVITDAFQFVTFAIFMPAILLWLFLFHLTGGAATFASQAYAATSMGLGRTSPFEIVGLVAAFLLGETLIPPYANRALASRTVQVSRNSFVLGGVFSIFWFMIMVSLGIVARTIVAKDTSEDYVLLNMVKTTMPTAGHALLLVVLMSVIMSSLNSLLNAGAVSFTQDIVRPFSPLTDRRALNVGRVATVSIAVAAALCAVAVNRIIDGLLTCYAIWAPAVLPALIIGLWVKHPRPLAGILSMGVGTAVAVTLWVVFRFVSHWPIEVCVYSIIIPGLCLALLAYLIGHRIGRVGQRV